MSTIVNEQTPYVSSESNLRGCLPQPDIVQSMTGNVYCQHLQQMADLSNQKRYSEQSMPYFEQDNQECSSHEPTLLYQ